jgi:reticulon-4-interacting protein 1, mitochondrial
MKAAIYSQSSPWGVKVVDRVLPTIEAPTAHPTTCTSIFFRIMYGVTSLVYRIISTLLSTYLQKRNPKFDEDYNHILSTSRKFDEFVQKEVKMHEEIEEKQQGNLMIVCQVKAGGLNPVDSKFLYGDKVPKWLEPIVQKFLENRVCGIDFAGVVIEAPHDSKWFKKGDEVFGTMPPSFGSFAERCVCPAHSLCLKPKNLTFEQAAAIPLVGLTAYQAFSDYGLRPGDHVCVLGASGGTGHVAVQVARSMGARVTSVCSKRNAAFVKELDSDDVVTYDDQDVYRGLREVCEKSGMFDIVFDSVSSHDSNDNQNDYRSRMTQLKLIHPRGMYINLGGDTYDWFKAHVKRFFNWNIFTQGHVLFWIRFPFSNRDLKKLKMLCENSQLRVKVAHQFPLTSEGVQSAFELQMSRRVKGKIVIQVS